MAPLALWAASAGKLFLQKQQMQKDYLGSKMKQIPGEKNPWRVAKNKNTTSVSMLHISGRQEISQEIPKFTVLVQSPTLSAAIIIGIFCPLSSMSGY